MADRYLLFDLGASNGRGIVATLEEGKIVFDIIHRFHNSPTFANKGEYFWDILALYSEVKKGIVLAQEKYSDIRSMSIDSWGCDFGMIDKDGRLIGNPLHYRDESQHVFSKTLHEILPKDDLFELSGGPCNNIMGIYKLFSMKNKRLIEYEQGKRLLMVPDIINYFLTGKACNEFTNATMTLMVNQDTRQWEPEILTRLGMRSDFLFPLVEPGFEIGEISPEVCEELGISPLKVVVCATHDTASAVLGIPVEDESVNWGYISLGTWCLAGLETAKPIKDKRVVDIEFGNEGGAYGKNLVVKNITGLWVIQKCREKWNRDIGETIHWDDIDEMALMETNQKCVIDICDERFGRVASDMPEIIRQYCEETYQDIPETIGQVASCVFRSLALKFKESFDDITDITGKPLEVLHLVGGGTQDPLVCQWAANALGIRTVAGPTETTAIGNLIVQLISDGKIANVGQGRKLCKSSNELTEYLPENQKEWAEHYRNFKKITKI